MIALVVNLMLMLAWSAVTGLFSLGNLVVGFLLGYFIIAFSLRDDVRFNSYGRKLPRALSFAVYFLKALAVSNLRVAYDVLTPAHHMQPAIIRMPLRARKASEITVLANFISLTPGTLSLDVDEVEEVLYVHVMYLGREEETLAELQDLERRVLELMR